jgi:signal transduction histidine kinase
MNSLGGRLIFYYSVVVTLTVGLALAVGFYLVRYHLITGTDFLLDAENKEIEAELQEIHPPITPEKVRKSIYQHAVLDANVYYFQVHNEKDEILFRSPNLETNFLPDLTHLFLPKGSAKKSVEVNGLGLVRVAEYYPGQIHVQIATGLQFLSSLTSRFSRMLAVGLPAVLVLSIFVGFILSKITLRPLRLIQTTATRISATNLSERIPPPKGNDELARLAVLLNDMFARLEKSFAHTRELTAEMSHELRTPLSIIRLHAEKALKNKDLDAEVSVELHDLLQEVLRLDDIINQLLVLAKAEAQALPLKVNSHSTSQFIEQFAEDAEALAENSQRKFELLRNEDVQVSFDAAWIRQVLFNLISNAIKFSPSRSRVRLESCRQNGHWRVALTDEGPGVPTDQFELIFEPFKQARHPTLDVDGAGLGLAVCKSIVELHSGRISCRRIEPDRGFEVAFSIPVRTPRGLIQGTSRA